jgi:hypothetical protein
MLALIVDDDPKIRAYIKDPPARMLRNLGSRRREPCTGDRRNGPWMYRSGRHRPSDAERRWTTLRERRKRTFPLIPNILSSGCTKPDTVFEFVEKPFAADTLAQVIRKLVDRPAKTA